MDGINLMFKLQKEVKNTQDSTSAVLINGQVDNWDKYQYMVCLLYTSPSPRDRQKSRMPSSA